MSLIVSDAQFPASESGEIRKEWEINVTYTVEVRW